MTRALALAGRLLAAIVAALATLLLAATPIRAALGA